MIVLTPTDTLRAYLGAAPATTNPSFGFAWGDDGTVSQVGNGKGVLAGTTPVDLVVPPAAGSNRVVRSGFIYNADSADVSITIDSYDGTTARVLTTLTLYTGYTLSLGDDGFRVVDATGTEAVAGVDSFNGRTGSVVPVSGDYTTGTVPEGGSLYFTDARADARITAQKGQASGLATLDAGGKLDAGQLPALAITETFVVASQAAMLALIAQQGDVAVRTDLNDSFILTTNDPTVLANWQELLTPVDGVSSFNGRTGSVTPASGDYNTTQVNEGSNLYFTAARVLASLLTGLSTATNAVITATDSVLAALGKLQAQISANVTALAGKLAKTSNLADLADVPVARTNLGLGTAATTAATDYATAAEGTLATNAVPNTRKINGDALSADLQLLPASLTKSLTATAEPFSLNSGSSNVATLAIGGRPLAQAVVTAIHQTDWQGRLALSNQPRTNEVTYSNGAGGTGWGSWNGGTATVTYTQGQASPDGGTNATLVSVTGLTAGSVAGPNQGFGVPSSNAGTPFTLSVLMKAASASCVIKISLDGALYPTLQYAYFDLVAGTFSNVSAGATAFMRSIGGGWYLCAVSAPCGATATGAALDIFTSTIGSSSFYLLDTQWEAGNNAGARIRTSGAAITVTDYTQAGTQPQITLGQNPATGATLDWDGTGDLPDIVLADRTINGKPLTADVALAAADVAAVAANATTGAAMPRSYTLATLPAASGSPGGVIFVSDHTAGCGICVSNGTSWIDVNTNAAVA